MFTCRLRRSSILATVLFGAAAPIWLGGCSSREAGATAETATLRRSSGGNDAVSNESSTVERPNLPPRAKTLALARAGDRPYDKTFDDLRFEIQPDQPFHREMLPDSVEALAGQRIRIRGFILPTPQKRGIREFVLVRDNQECCFGPGAALYDCIVVKMQGAKTAEFSIRPVAVEGTFDVREIRLPDGKCLAIYHLEGESVK